jgi:hypothetical protein
MSQIFTLMNPETLLTTSVEESKHSEEISTMDIATIVIAPYG